MLAWLAFGLHTVGDYFTESDFYGGYAAGARLIRHGVWDPARYPVVGPGFDAALALVGNVVPEGFTAARLLSVAAAVGSLIAWYAVLSRRIGGWAGVGTLALLATNAVFLRYGMSATTDMWCTGLMSATAFLLLGARSRAAPLAGGVLAGLATLTRYNAVALLPAGIVSLAWLAPSPAVTRRWAVGSFLVGFLVTCVPWLAHSFATGHPLGASLFENYGFYSLNDASRNVQDASGTVSGVLPERTSFPTFVERDPPGFATKLLLAIPDHLARDARELLWLPVALAVLAGAIACVWRGAWRRLLPIGALGAFVFAALLLVFYSDRYSLPLAPIYLSATGWWLGDALGRRGGARLGLVAAGVVLVAASAVNSAATLTRVLAQMPIEVKSAGAALAADASRGDRVISRKGHIGYYSGLEVVPFPRFEALQDFADYAKRSRARYLYYSWYEAGLRPEFEFLLDTTAAVPGLTRLHVTWDKPSVTYRIDDGFGQAPSWLSDPFVVSLHRARGRVVAGVDTALWRDHTVLATEALSAGRWEEAVNHARAATAMYPRDTLAWIVEGAAHEQLGRAGAARDAYRRALELDPRDAEARSGLERAGGK